MANVEFKQQDIKDLVDKLGGILDSLSEQERILLVAIFAAAANHAVVSGKDLAMLPVPKIRGERRREGGRGELTAEELKEQLLKAYVPGKYLGTVTHSADKIVGVPPGP